MIKIDNLDQVNLGINKWLEEVETLAVGSMRGLSIQMFYKALENTPQFSGNAVANWRYAVNGVDRSVDNVFQEIFWAEVKDQWPETVHAFSKEEPNEDAHSWAVGHTDGRASKVSKLSDVVNITNSVLYDEWLAKATLAQLRSANHVGQLIGHTTADVAEANMVITTAKALKLSKEKM